MKSEDHDPRWLCDREKTRSRSGLALVLWIVGWARAVTAAVGGAAPLSSVEVPKQLTLFEARRLAFAHNWDLLAAKSDIDVATAQTIIAREFPNLAVAYSTAKIPADNHSSSTEGGNGLWQRNYDTIIAINQLFEIGGKRSSRRASADAGFEGARARLLEAKRQLDLAVTRAYIAALQAASDVKILRQSSESLRSEARIAESRLAAGDISKSDKNQIEIAAERFELDARSADTTAATLRPALEALLGSTHPTGDWVAVDTLDSLISAAPAEDNISAEPRPDLLAAEAGLKKTEADMRLQKALRIPDPTVQLLYEHEPPDQPNTLGLGLSFPLPLWNRNRGGIRSAEAARDQALLAIGKVRTQIASEIESARLRYRDAADRWRRYRDEIQPRSEEVREAVSFAYAKGGAALLDLLTAERNANDVRLATSQAAADSALAGATLQAALNLPGAGADRK